MAVELRLTRTLAGLVPSDEESKEAMKAWKLGAALKCEVRMERRNERLRWYWKLCQIVHDNSERFGSQEEVSDTIKLGCGVVTTTQVYEHGEWRIERKPGSIAFRNMEEPAFREFTLRAQAFVCSMLGCEEADLLAALEDFLNPDSRRAA